MTERIKNLCKKNNISVLELEKRLEIGTSTIRRWEKSIPAADKLYKVAKYFEVSMEYILTGKENEYTQEEIDLIRLYREADDRGKERIMQDAIIEANTGKSSDSAIS